MWVPVFGADANALSSLIRAVAAPATKQVTWVRLTGRKTNSPSQCRGATLRCLRLLLLLLLFFVVALSKWPSFFVA